MIQKILEIPIIYNWSQRIVSLNKEVNGKWLKEVINPDDEDFILDLGCGTGRYAELFSGHYFGVDINKEYIRYAREGHKGEFLLMDATTLTFPDNMFDYIFSVGFLHHLDDKKVHFVLREAERVCKPDGKIVILEPILPINRFNLPGYIFCKLDRGKFIRSLENFSKILSANSSKNLRYSRKKHFFLEIGFFVLE